MSSGVGESKRALLSLLGGAWPERAPAAGEWHEIAAMAAEHRLGPLLAHRLSHGSEAWPVPPAVADEWRSAAAPEQSRAALERARETLGRVVSRAPVRAAEQQNSSGELRGHTLSLIYNTKFERADAIEQLTLVERDGRWQLARYSVNSDALK